MANTITKFTPIRAKPHASAEKQVGASDPQGRTDVINRGPLGIQAILTRMLATLFDGLTVDFTDQTTVSAFTDIQLQKILSMRKGADLASAATLTLGTDGNYFVVTGTTGITAISSAVAGTLVMLRFNGALTITHNATTLILQGSVNLATAAGDVVAFVSEGGGNWREAWRRLATASAGTGTLTSVQVFTANGTWTRPAGITKVVVEVVGPGGGSAGSDTTGAGTASVGGSGGGGGYARKLLDVSSISTSTITVPAGGAGGAAGANDGTAGGTSSWSDGTNTVSATGGGGGGNQAALSGNRAGGAPGAGGAGSGGDFNATGSPGHRGARFGTAAYSGSGGASLFGGGGTSASQAVGVAGSDYGGGASGASGADGDAARAGAAGGRGLIVVTEYK